MTDCHCGRPLHYTDRDLQSLVQGYVDALGENIVCIASDGRRWLVPRHYIALHGVAEQDLSKLGFEAVRDQ